MMEMYTQLFTKPFSLNLDLALRSRANAEVRGLVRDENDHKFAQKVEEEMDKSDEVIQMTQNDFDKKLATAVQKGIKKEL